MENKSILDIEVSCFANYDTPANPQKVNLLRWLTSTKYKDRVEAIRGMDDKSGRDKIKATLPAITPSGIFTYRSQTNLTQHSGFIQIDLDLTGTNKLITNWEGLKSELMKIENIAYLGKSVSGRGYWGLIPIPPDQINHRLYFEGLEKIFIEKFKIELDNKPKNVASLRGYSFDDNAYFNHEAKPFTFKVDPIIKQKIPILKTGIKSSGLEDWIIKKLETSQEGERHGDRLKLARYAGGLVAGGHLESGYEERLIQSYLSQYGHIDSHQIQAKEIKAIQDGYKDGLRSPIDLSDHHRPTFQKGKSIYKSNHSEEVLPKQLTKEGFENYASHLHIENGMLLNGMGYPADWDLIGTYTDDKTKDFIRMSLKNPSLIQLRNKFDLS